MQGVITDDTKSCQLDRISEKVAERVGSQKYKIWFERSVRISLCDGLVKVAASNPFIASWIERHFTGEIKAAVNEVLPEQRKLSFVVDAAIGMQTKAAPFEAGLDAEQKSRFLRGSVVKSKTAGQKAGLTLDSFVVGSSNQLAYNAALTVVRDEKVSFNPLFVHGGYGVGKTHLLQGICDAVGRSRSGTVWLYLSAEDFVNQFVLALKTKKLEAFRRRIRATDLLAIDDIHFLASKPSTQEEFLHTFNSIDLAGRQVVLASDAHPKMIGELSEKLVNRFISGMVVKIESPDFATRCEIVRRFSQSRGAGFPEPVIKYIAENLRSNVRELEGAVLKVIAFSQMQNKPVTLALAQEILAEHIERSDPIICVADIVAAAASFFGLSSGDLNSPRKDRTASLARHFSMYLARKHTALSTTEIGKAMGNKNHATVIVGTRQVANYLAADQQLHWLTAAGNRVAKAKAILASLETIIAG